MMEIYIFSFFCFVFHSLSSSVHPCLLFLLLQAVRAHSTLGFTSGSPWSHAHGINKKETLLQQHEFNEQKTNSIISSRIQANCCLRMEKEQEDEPMCEQFSRLFLCCSTIVIFSNGISRDFFCYVLKIDFLRWKFKNSTFSLIFNSFYQFQLVSFHLANVSIV